MSRPSPIDCSCFPIIENCPDPEVISYLEWREEQRQICLAARCISCAITRHKKEPCCPCPRDGIEDGVEQYEIKHYPMECKLRELNDY